MKKSEVNVGGTYRVKVSGNLVDVRITAENPRGGWDGVNTITNRKVRIKSAQRLRAVAAERPARRRKVVSLAEYEAETAAPVEAGPTTDGVAESAPAAKKAGKAADGARAAKGRATGEPGAKDGGPKRLSALSAAAKVLAERDPADGPLSCAQMIERMAAKGYWSPARGGLTPASTLYSAILREIKVKGEDSRFAKADRGHFELTAAGKEAE